MAAEGNRWIRRIFLWGLPALAVAGVAAFMLAPVTEVSTEDAYIKADKTVVGAEIDGVVRERLVEENEPVSAGQLVLVLDTREAEIDLAEAESALDGVRRDYAALRARLASSRSELDSARRELAYAVREQARQRELESRKLVSASRLDEATHVADLASGRVAVLEGQVAEIETRLGMPRVTKVEEGADYRRAATAVARARLTLERARITAPRAGIASKLPQVGDRLRQGSPAFAIVDDSRPWLEANFKETELGHLRVGQPATLHVDAYPDEVWQGRVESISQATGAEFSVLPPQNASGNWVKVVQRVPVRIAVTGGPKEHVLRAGMSVVVEVDVRPGAAAATGAGGV